LADIYLLMVVALAALAAADLVVGVSNDAINFLNSAIGSKVVSFRTTMIVASLGIFIGATTSSGIMEVARKGIFNPGEFMFSEIMVIFMAVMITDILLLDFFNTLGMPTSTTVSIVFELLGASVAMALIKIAGNNAEGFSDLSTYINTDKAVQIILGILLSVVIAFSIGALVQYVSRIIFSFHFDRKLKTIGATFGGVALTAITYFIFLKGLKGTPFYKNMQGIVEGNEFLIVAASLVFWTLFSIAYMKVFKKDILALIIIVGTFGLALAFAGNDLVNFIGVPMAAFHSYEAWSGSGIAADAFPMVDLAEKVPTEPGLLLIAGAIMVLTLWFSKKARTVAGTEIGLSTQGETTEKFEPNLVSRMVVRSAQSINKMFNTLLPKSVQESIDSRFKKPVLTLAESKDYEVPAFDAIRASVNLMVAGVLISIATSYKLPLSTTYVTFMVAMGTSLADRAWGSESAVYRVAGVLNVIGGWFFTAFAAFTAAATMAYLINLGGPTAIAILLFLAVLLLGRNFIAHKNKSELQKAEDSLNAAEESSVLGVINESSKNISKVIKRSNKIYSNAINGLAAQDLELLKKNKKQVIKLSDEIDTLRDNIFYFIKNLDDSSVSASHFYINILSYLQDIGQSLEYVSNASHKHINNNHKELKPKQIKELKEIESLISNLLSETETAFNEQNFTEISAILEDKTTIKRIVKEKIQSQVERTRTEESSPKNTTLYFSLILESKDLLNAVANLLSEYQQADTRHKETV